jgi:hypothetical protein
MKHILFAVCLIFLFFPLVSALSTDISIKTLSGHTVFITPIDPTTEETLIAPQQFKADPFGKVQYTFSNEDVSSFKVRVVVKLFGETKFREIFGPFSAGNPVEIELLPEGYVDYAEQQETTLKVNTEINNSNNETSNETALTAVPETVPEETVQEETASPVTGSVIGSFSSKKTLKIVYYAVGAILLVGVVSFFIVAVVSKRRNKNNQFGMQPVKLNGLPPKEEAYDSRTDSQLSKIEKEIGLVEREIENYRRKNRLLDAEKKLEEKKRLLAQLRGGSFSQPQSGLHPKHHHHIRPTFKTRQEIRSNPQDSTRIQPQNQPANNLPDNNQQGNNKPADDQNLPGSF